MYKGTVQILAREGKGLPIACATLRSNEVLLWEQPYVRGQTMQKSTPLSVRRTAIQQQIAVHPLLAFITLAYTISWMAWFFLYRSDLRLLNGFAIIGALGPALAAMIISAIREPELSPAPTGTRWKLFGILFAGFVASLFMRRLWLTTELTSVSGRIVTDQIYPSLGVFLLDLLAVALAAFVLSGFQSSRQGVCNLLRSLNFRQYGSRWYWSLIALWVYPAVIVLGNAISAGFGLPRLASKATGPGYLLALDICISFLVTFFGGGGLEEPGWRGIALPLLKKRCSPLGASLILAVIWAFWHWPLFWFGFYGGGPWGVLSFLLGCIPIAVLFTAVFHWTKNSLPIVMLLHTSINVTPTFLPTTAIGSGLWWVLMLGIAFWMWRSPRSFS